MSHFPLPAWEEHSVIIHKIPSVIIHKIPSLLSCKPPFQTVKPSREPHLGLAGVPSKLSEDGGAIALPVSATMPTGADLRAFRMRSCRP